MWKHCRETMIELADFVVARATLQKTEEPFTQRGAAATVVGASNAPGSFGAIPAVCAQTVFWEANGRDEIRQCLILQGCQAEPATDAIDHFFELVRGGVKVIGRRRAVTAFDLSNCATACEIELGSRP